jgi:hypothetical protein
MRLAVIILLPLGCGWQPFEPSKATPTAPADASVDTATADAVVAVIEDSARGDTRPFDTLVSDPIPPTCARPLDASFRCDTPAAKSGSTACTEAMLNELAACFGEGDASRCSAAQKSYPVCSKCVIEQWLYDSRFLDVGACLRIVAPTSACGTTWPCNIDCLSAVCGECDETPGSGKTVATSERMDCERDAARAATTVKPAGACYEVSSKALAACIADPSLSICFVRSPDDLLPFLRGACRDGGDWSRALEP